MASRTCTSTTPPPWPGRTSPPQRVAHPRQPDPITASRRRGASSTCTGAVATVVSARVESSESIEVSICRWDARQGRAGMATGGLRRLSAVSLRQCRRVWTGQWTGHGCTTSGKGDTTYIVNLFHQYLIINNSSINRFQGLK